MVGWRFSVWLSVCGRRLRRRLSFRRQSRVPQVFSRFVVFHLAGLHGLARPRSLQTADNDAILGRDTVDDLALGLAGRVDLFEALWGPDHFDGHDDLQAVGLVNRQALSEEDAESDKAVPYRWQLAKNGYEFIAEAKVFDTEPEVPGPVVQDLEDGVDILAGLDGGYEQEEDGEQRELFAGSAG